MTLVSEGPSCFYLHGVVHARDAGLAGPGLLGAPNLGAVRDGQLAILYTDLAGLGLSPSDIEERMATAREAEALVREHKEVLCRLQDHAAGLLPFPLCTLFRDLAGIGSILRTEASAFEDALDRVAGAAEWSIKIIRDGEGAGTDATVETDDRLTSIDSALETASPGQRFLLERRRQREAVAVGRKVLTEQVQRFHQALIGAARSGMRLALSGADGTSRTAFKAAYLVDRTDQPTFLAHVDNHAAGLSSLGWTTMIQGPWPAFSFSRIDRAA